jgi:glyoxylase-like metal-dependent hydrolase (beta-lactamase superfamily II)
VISHPHYYSTHLTWAKVFDCPVYVASEDEEWLNRNDSEGMRHLIHDAEQEIIGVRALKAGGHFDGSLLLHWENKLFTADTIMMVPVGAFLRSLQCDPLCLEPISIACSYR